jgi:hypothetical protein
VFLVIRPLLDPFVQDCNLPRREFFAGVCGRHFLVLVAGVDPDMGVTFPEFAWNDGPDPVVLRESPLTGVQAAIGLARFLVESVAVEAVLGENGPHVAVELDLGRERSLFSEENGAGNQNPEGEQMKRRDRHRMMESNKETTLAAFGN